MAMTKSINDTTVGGKENSDEQVIFLYCISVNICING